MKVLTQSPKLPSYVSGPQKVNTVPLAPSSSPSNRLATTMLSYGAVTWVIIIALFMSATSYVNSKQLHESLSRDELKRIFQVDSYDEVPPYEVVELSSRSRRSVANQKGEVEIHRRISFTTQNSTQVLNLRPNTHLARHVPIFFADIDDNNKSVVVNPAPATLDEDVGEPYQDEQTMAAVIVRKDPNTGQILMDGTIGEELVVRSIPSSVFDVIQQSQRGSSVADNLGGDLPWRREEETDLNSIRPPDDEAFLDQDGGIYGDLVFSDGFPTVADDDTKSGRSPHTRQPYLGHDGIKNKTELPEGLELVKRKRRDAASDVTGKHIVYKRITPATESDYLPIPGAEDLIASQSKPGGRYRRDAPSVIYPEILVLVDYDGYLLHGQDNSKIKSYYVSFWNGADLRYRLLRDPAVKISIAGIIISRGRDAMPYLERNRVGRDAIDSASALTDMGKYLFQERRLPTYDIAVAITKLDMCRREHEGGHCNRGTAGFAYVGGACVVNKKLKKVNSVAIVEDTGGFSGIIVAAHEVGHLLGAVHDGSPPPAYLGGPGARRCRWEDGYIMSDLRHTAKGFQWSRCTTEQFHHFLNGDTATCLYNLPHEEESLPRILPGKLLSLDQQCRKDRGTSACFKDERVCAQLFCFDSTSGFCVSYRPAAEGSECGSGKICLNGRCVYDNENSINDQNFSSDDSITKTTISKPIITKTTTKRKPKTTPRKTTPRHITTPRTTTTRRTTTPRTTTTRRTTTPRPTTRRTTTPRPTTRRTTTQKPTTTTTPKPSTTTTPKPTTTTPKPTIRTTGRFSPKTSRRTTTSTSTTSRSSSISTSTTPKAYKNFNKNKIDNYDDGECQDRIVNITGSLTCREFLKSYGARYCGHRYIMKNCCSARKAICKNTRLKL